MTDEPASRNDLRDLARRVDMLDEHGTRGVGVLAVQVQEIAKDVARLETQLAEHAKEHQRAERDRIAGRRWLIGAVIGAIAAVDVPTLYVILSRGR